MSVESVRQCLIMRFRNRHLDLVPKYGIVNIMDAIDSEAYFVGDVEEIGSSDINCWMNSVIESLKRQEEVGLT